VRERGDVKTKTITTSYCQDCARFDHAPPHWREICPVLDRKIEQDSDTGTYPIPDDCPLDDAPSNGQATAPLYDPDDGNWYASTLGHFVGLLIDSGDEAVVFRTVEIGEPDEDGKYCQTFEVITAPNGHVGELIEGCRGVHKTLAALLEVGVVT